MSRVLVRLSSLDCTHVEIDGFLLGWFAPEGRDDELLAGEVSGSVERVNMTAE